MKYRVACAIMAVVALTSPFLGCTSTGGPVELAPILPGNDPVVVNAERAANAALASFESVTRFDHNNLAFMKETLPKVHSEVQDLRRTFPEKYRAVREATKTYKASKTAQDAQLVTDSLAQLRELQLIADRTLADSVSAVRAARPQ